MADRASAGADAAGDNIARGIGLTILSVAIFGVQDAVVKALVQDYSPFQISMMRYWAFALFSVLLVMRQAPLRQAFQSKAPRWQVARGVLLMADVWMFAIALRTVPLGELQSISMIYPLLVTLMAVPLLGEKVGAFRVGAVVAGFAGALVIIRPGGLPLDIGVLFAALSAAGYAGYVVCTRKAAQIDSTATCMIYVSVIGMLLSSAVGVFFFEPMDWRGAMLLAVVMGTMICAHALMMVALRHAPASVLQPFNYLILPWAIVLSFVIFGHLIDFVSLIGAAVVAGAGLTIWWRERRRKIDVTDPETTPAGRE